MKERFWTIECCATDANERGRRQRHTVTTELLLESIELLLTEYDGEHEVELVVRSLPDGTRLVVFDPADEPRARTLREGRFA
jgi:hypothetical protein